MTCQNADLNLLFLTLSSSYLNNSIFIDLQNLKAVLLIIIPTSAWNSLYLISESKKENLFCSLCALTHFTEAVLYVLHWDSISKELKIYFRSSQCPTSLVSVLGIRRMTKGLRVSWRWNKVYSIQEKGLYGKCPSNCSVRETLAPSPGNLYCSRTAQGIKNGYLGSKSFRSSICQKHSLPSCARSAQVQKCWRSQESLLLYK